MDWGTLGSWLELKQNFKSSAKGKTCMWIREHTLWTWANFCGWSGGKKGANKHWAVHFRRSTRQAAHAEVPNADTITILKRRYECIYSSSAPSTQVISHLRCHSSSLPSPLSPISIFSCCFHSLLPMLSFPCFFSMLSIPPSWGSGKLCNPTCWVTSAGRLVQRLISPFLNPKIVNNHF